MATGGVEVITWTTSVLDDFDAFFDLITEHYRSLDGSRGFMSYTKLFYWCLNNNYTIQEAFVDTLPRDAYRYLGETTRDRIRMHASVTEARAVLNRLFDNTEAWLPSKENFS